MFLFPSVIPLRSVKVYVNVFPSFVTSVGTSIVFSEFILTTGLPKGTLSTVKTAVTEAVSSFTVRGVIESKVSSGAMVSIVRVPSSTGFGTIAFPALSTASTENVRSPSYVPTVLILKTQL